MSKKDKAILIGVCLPEDREEDKANSLRELANLAATAGLKCVDRHLQKRRQIDAAYYAGKGLLEQVALQAETEDAAVVIFDNELTATQVRNIQQDFGFRVIDRTEVILQIFHDHARTREARLQVKLAELEYQLPRLTRLWSHLDRERGRSSGAGGAARGMGEKQIEIDRRKITQAIRTTKKELEKIDVQQETRHQTREKARKVCLVGYTNAGKSTLFNALTGENVLVADRLFATLSSVARQMQTRIGHDLIISDTVGFIANLPHHLVASFRATLRDVQEADLLIQVIDSADPDYRQQDSQVKQVLNEIGASGIPLLPVLNKIDLLPRPEADELSRDQSPIAISARRGDNLDRLKQKITELLFPAQEIRFFIPHTAAGILSHLHQVGQVLEQTADEQGVLVRVLLTEEDASRFNPYRIDHESVNRKMILNYTR